MWLQYLKYDYSLLFLKKDTEGVEKYCNWIVIYLFWFSSLHTYLIYKTYDESKYNVIQRETIISRNTKWGRTLKGGEDLHISWEGGRVDMF